MENTICEFEIPNSASRNRKLKFGKSDLEIPNSDLNLGFGIWKSELCFQNPISKFQISISELEIGIPISESIFEFPFSDFAP